ncbi:MAG: excinuclease ABC subunit UvrC [Candidatus Saccharimonadales bacterium]
MNLQLSKKLEQLPKEPGVYFHKDKQGRTIYIGKAANLRNRVRQYFQASRFRDAKTDALVKEIADVDWITVDSEIDALFLEAEQVRRNLPRYNILLRDDKSSSYVRINYKADHPTVSYTHRPLDDGAQYFGPYFNTVAVKRAMRFLRKAFPYSTHSSSVPKRACLFYHLGLCPGLEEDKTSLVDYRANLRKLIKYLKGERQQLIKQVEKEMQQFAKQGHFEAAAQARNQLFALKGLSRQIIFSDKEFMDISKDRALFGLAQMLGMPAAPRRIEGYDISHMQGTDTVASMVVFTNGIPDKTQYRKFKMRLPGNDDFAHMNEAIGRRLSDKNRRAWTLPDLFLIDGGKGQLDAALKARDAAGLSMPMIGLAKREEEIVVDNQRSNLQINLEALRANQAIVTDNGRFTVILLPKNSDVVKLLQRIRDESHRFAVSYHSVLKVKRISSSLLDDIPGIGPATRKKLLRTFGSVRGISQAPAAELNKVVSPKIAALLTQNLVSPPKRARPE